MRDPLTSALLADLPLDLDPSTLAEAEEIIAGLGRALFPTTTPSMGQLTWPDRPEVEALTDDGSVRSMAERLARAEARFRVLIEQIPAVTFMAVLGEGENEVYVSPHIEQMLGYSQQEWLADPFLWYNRLHADDRKLWNEEFARGCRTGGPFRAECRFLARDGHVVWVLGEARVVKDEIGRPQFLQGVAFDITESKRAQEVLLQSAVETARMEEELEIARRVQLSLLPSTKRLGRFALGSTMVAATEVGGDYYDAIPTLDAGWLAVGDVSGHGLNAGLVMLMLQSAVAGLVHSRPISSPREILCMLNEVLYDNISARLKRNEYVTLCLLRLGADGTVTFAGAHQDLLVVRKSGGVERIPTPGTWVGIRQQIRMMTIDSRITLAPGDRLVLYTDGIIEAANDSETQFDIPRLMAVVDETRGAPPQVVADTVIARVRAFSRHQEDDMTILVADYEG